MFLTRWLICFFACGFSLKHTNALERRNAFQHYQSFKYTQFAPAYQEPSQLLSALDTLRPEASDVDDTDIEEALMPFNKPAFPKAVTVPGKPRVPQQREEGSFCRRSFDGRSGYCIVAHQCLHVMHEYRVHGTRIDVCTYRRNIPVVCCPLADKHFEEQRISEKKCHEHHDALSGIKLDVPRVFSGKQCIPSVPLIVGGEVTNTGHYPHMAALGWTQDRTDIKWKCGGTLISVAFVLTAAHCATSGDKPPDLVRLGASNLNENTTAQQDIAISIIILHPKYRSSAYYHDIALLKLADRAQFSDLVRPACLWQMPDMGVDTVIATGWGHTKFMGARSDDLQKVGLNLMEQSFCKQFYGRERRLPRGIIDAQFCAGHLEGGKDTCQGDSGGPLHAELPEYKCVKFVVGITSFGKSCAAPNTPGVYTKIYPYLDWIERIAFAN